MLRREIKTYAIDNAVTLFDIKNPDANKTMPMTWKIK